MTTQITDPDSSAIHRAASDYYGGWYEANVERISRSLHPDLAKRAIRKDENGNDFLYHLSKEQMLGKTKEGGGSDTPIAKQRFEITILDRYEEIAIVKVVANEYIDYLQLAKQDGQWLIVNALWTDNRAKQ
ncbi:MAG: nuclear transport factor 2 family protein [Anaerolineae bacterium]|nr:nuclear transport factor 2 family protein [Anaerolineae bacterium]